MGYLARIRAKALQCGSYTSQEQAGKQGIGVNDAHDFRPDGQNSRSRPRITASATSTGTAWVAYPATVGSNRHTISRPRTVPSARFIHDFPVLGSPGTGGASVATL